MNNPPFWSHSQLPRHPYYYYSPSPVFQTQQPVHHHPQPVHQYAQLVQHDPARKPSSSASKFVQIPVQFINSEPAQPVVPARSKSESAVKIQKVFRGFLVRKSLKKIKVIEKEVEDIERRVSTSEYVELLRENERERLKVNEMLMGLLFKLDSIRGFGSGVRHCRKAAIKKAIAIQERVDAIVSTKIDESEVTGASDKPVDRKEENMTEMHQSEEQKEGSVTIEAENAVNEGSKSEDSVRIEVGNAENEASEAGEVEKMRASSEGNWDGLVETRANDTSVEEKDAGVDLEMKAEGEGCDEKEEKGMWGESEGVKMSDTEDEKVETRRKEEEVCDEKEEGMCGECECVESVDEGGECEAEDEKIEARGKEEEEGCDEKEKGLWDMSEFSENVDGGGESRKAETRGEEEEEEEEEEHEGGDAKKNEMWGVSESEDEGGEKKNDDLDAKERNTELLERMMEDNAKMMSLMTQLFERNEMQTRMLYSLTQRVEQLEKAFMCGKMRRKKKRHGA